MHLKKLISLFLLIWVASVEARDVHGVSVPESFIVDHDKALKLQGAGLRRQFFFQVYVAALYVPKLGMSTEALLYGPEPKVMTLKFLRDVDWDDVTEALEEGLKANTSAKELARMGGAIRDMNALIKRVGGVKEGGVLRLQCEQEGVIFTLNEMELGAIAMPGLSAALLKIWIGEHPVQANLKAQLLGGA